MSIYEDNKSSDVTKLQNSKDEEEYNFFSIKTVGGIFIISLIITLLSAYGYFLGDRPFMQVDNVPPTAPFLLLLLILGFQRIFKKVFKRNLFSKKWTMMVYWIGMVAGNVAGRGFLYYGIIVLMSWQRIIFLEHQRVQFFGPLYTEFSSLIIPKERGIIRDFWMGDSTVTWSVWIGPMITWIGFFLVAYFLLLCVTTLFTNQWIKVERLQFPLTRPILQIVDIDNRKGERGNKPFWANKWSYVGIIVGGIVLTLPTSLHNYFPVIPVTSPIMLPIMDVSILSDRMRDALVAWPPILSDFGRGGTIRYFRIDPTFLAIGFFVNLEVLFSIWFFVFVHIAARYIGFGIRETHHGIENNVIVTGALMGILVYSLWTARYQLLDIIKKALGKKKVDDFDAPLAFRTAVWGGLCSFIILVLFAKYFLYLDIIYGVIFFFMFAAIAIAWTRVRAESGIPVNENHEGFWEYHNIVQVFGYERMGARNLAGFSFFVPITYGIFGTLAAMSMETYRAVDDYKIKKRHVSYALFTTVAITMVLCFIIGLRLIHSEGAMQMWGFWWHTAGHFRQAFNVYVQWWTDTGWRAIIQGSVGVLITMVLMVLRSMFVWLPLHPVGAVIAINGASYWYWQSFFFIWLVKWLVMRYAGSRYLIPVSNFFIGLLVGQIVVNGMFTVIGMILGY